MAFGAFSTTSATPVDAAPRRRSRVALLLLLPGIAYLALFFLVPLVNLVITSLETPLPQGDFGQYQYDSNFAQYGDVVGQYLPQILRSFLYALLATVFALLFSYPLAYFTGVTLRRFPLVQALALTLVIAPFFISFLLRTLAWKQILSDEGPVVSALKGLSLLGSDGHITGEPSAVIFGLTYNFIPFMALPIYTSLERLDLRFLEAGADLYANPATTFFRVTLPLSLPGVVSGTLLTFIPATGDYVNASPQFLGSTQTTMVGNVISDTYFNLSDYPSSAALSIILMVLILIPVGVYLSLTKTEDLL